MAIGCWAVLSQAEPEIKRAHILLAADAVAYDEDIAAHVGVGDSTFYRTKRRFVLGNVEAALSEEPRPGGERKLSGKEDALLVATACAQPPQERAGWTLELLRQKIVELTDHTSVSRETVRRRLAEMISSPSARRCGASRKLIARMWPARKTCLTSMPKPPIPGTR